MKYKLVIFDMDGTILNTLDDLAAGLNFSLNALGYPLRTTDEVKSFVGNGIRKLIERGAPENASSEDTDRLFAVFNEYYAAHCADNTKPYDGIEELLHKLKSNGIKTAVVSNKADYAVRELCEKYFDGLFDCALGERNGIRKKPAPDSVNEVLSTLGIDRSDAVYVGDSEVDILTAKNAETDCIIVEWGFRERDFLKSQGAETLVSSVEELEKLCI